MSDVLPAPASSPLGPPRDRTVVLVGLMGVGKTSIGKRLAVALGLPFRDADEEIETAAGRSIADIFAERGEQEFRDGERRVIARLLDDPPMFSPPAAALVNPQTREVVLSRATTVWLKTDLEILAKRVSRKATRPLLIGRDPLEVLTAQAEVRYPAYAEAHLTVDTGDATHSNAVEAILQALSEHARAGASPS